MAKLLAHIKMTGLTFLLLLALSGGFLTGVFVPSRQPDQVLHNVVIAIATVTAIFLLAGQNRVCNQLGCATAFAMFSGVAMAVFMATPSATAAHGLALIIVCLTGGFALALAGRSLYLQYRASPLSATYLQ